MNATILSARRPAALLLALVALGCLPIWAVGFFVTQDGPAHAYTAQLMLDLLHGDAGAETFVRFNSWLVPNSSGHWLLALLLQVVTPFTATKLLATLTYAGLVAALGFLRCATVGREGLETSLLFASAVAFNWLWLCGLYNFVIGVIGFAIATGLMQLWRQRLSLPRVFVLALLLLLVYFSHIVAFGLAATICLLLALDVPPSQRPRVLAATAVALLPASGLALVHAAGQAGGAWFPVWRRLADPQSLASWFFQLRTADPFVLISRRSLPFTGLTSDAFALLAPLLWLGVGLAFLAVATVRSSEGGRWMRANRPVAALFAVCAALAAFGPDDFGTTHGTLLRERLTLLGAVLVVPLFRTTKATGGPARGLKGAWFCFAVVFLFQTVALWEFALRSDRDTREFQALGPEISGSRSVASVVVLEDGGRFHANPVAQLGNFLGIGSGLVVWDNYELGYDLFPLLARKSEDARFVLEFTRSNVFDPNAPASLRRAQVEELDACLASGGERIDTLLLWNRDPEVEAVIQKRFAVRPYFEFGRGRLYRRDGSP